MKTKAIFALVIIGSLVLCLAASQPAMASDEEQILQVVVDFFEAFNTCDYKLMSSLWLHSPKTSEFGDLESAAFLTQGWEAIDAIWKGVFTLPPGTFSFSLHHPQVTLLGDNVAIVTAYNNGAINPPAVNEQRVILVRETFVVQKTNGKWQIVHSHASNLPIN